MKMLYKKHCQTARLCGQAAGIKDKRSSLRAPPADSEKSARLKQYVIYLL